MLLKWQVSTKICVNESQITLWYNIMYAPLKLLVCSSLVVSSELHGIHLKVKSKLLSTFSGTVWLISSCCIPAHSVTMRHPQAWTSLTNNPVL